MASSLIIALTGSVTSALSSSLGPFKFFEPPDGYLNWAHAIYPAIRRGTLDRRVLPLVFFNPTAQSLINGGRRKMHLESPESDRRSK